MKFKYEILIILIILIILSLILIIKPDPKESPTISEVCFNSTCINVELSLTPAEQAKGLMFRENLSGGMLFVYDYAGEKSFWMKNTLIPLDIIWINSNLELVAIEHASPCKNSCQTYTHPGKYVLEVNQNFTELNSIKIGDTVILN